MFGRAESRVVALEHADLRRPKEDSKHLFVADIALRPRLLVQLPELAAGNLHLMPYFSAQNEVSLLGIANFAHSSGGKLNTLLGVDLLKQECLVHCLLLLVVRGRLAQVLVVKSGNDLLERFQVELWFIGAVELTKEK